MNPLSPMQAMQMAIEEGKKGVGFVSPNPLVGCVILDRGGNFLSSGFHAQLGGDHAEAAALNKISGNKNLDGARVYVTLEPCAHQGRTPSCAKALAELPIASVTYGLSDPNPKVAGQGAEILRKAGKNAEIFKGLQDELEELAEIFLLNMRKNRPFVALKIASSLDGKIALEDGTSQWITGPEAREQVGFLRGNYDAVLTGVGTILKDNPRMNSRAEMFAAKPQRLVILDPNGSCLTRLESLNISKVRRAQDIFVVTKPGAVQDFKSATIIESPLKGEHFNLENVLSRLTSEGIHSIFVEAGGQTSSAFLQSGLMDRIFIFMAPKILGAGLSWTSGLKIPSLDKPLRLEKPRLSQVGQDLLLTARSQT